MGLESGGRHFESISSKQIEASTTFYPYALTNPDIWEATRAMVGTGSSWVKGKIRGHKEAFKSEPFKQRAKRVGSIAFGSTYAVYPFTTDVLTVLLAKETGDPITAALLFAAADVPVLGGAEYAWRKMEHRKRAAADATESLNGQNLVLTGIENSELELEQDDKSLKPHERSLVAKAMRPIVGRFRHGQTITTNLYAGSQAGQLEEMALISRENTESKYKKFHLPKPGWLTAKHVGLFSLESMALASVAASGHSNPTMDAALNLALTIGLPTYLADRALSYGFDVKPGKSLSYQGYEKIVDMVKKLRRTNESSNLSNLPAAGTVYARGESPSVSITETE